MQSPDSPHASTALREWTRLQQRINGDILHLDGTGLQIADVVAVAHHAVTPSISPSPEVLNNIESSVTALSNHLENGWYVYGVNTGFGGSADARTDQVVALQSALMQLTQAGILSPADTGRSGADGRSNAQTSSAMPASWVKATMVVRCNATVRGHSAVKLKVIQAVLDLLKYRIVPVVPLRGTVSASGDLMPLAYIAGAIEGNPDIFVQAPNGAGVQVLPSHRALDDANLEPVIFGPKEGLGLVNGTASSAALGALVMYRVNHQSVLIQALSAMAVEALGGSAGSFDPFIPAVRPHPGQIETSRNIASFLEGSKLARMLVNPKDRRSGDLMQDRYSLRSAPQWIGPQLEDIALAERQISTELNSSCDNPLIDTQDGNGDGAIHYGCNFQASSVTSAMEKTRLSTQMLGRLLFSQLSEMVDPALSGGLPPNLAADDPSISFTFKGVDIAMASYMGELSYLANPMSSHVQPAEMHNQSLNSMAFASARKTMEATEILAQMCASHLYACCQAVDLRVLYRSFIEAAGLCLTLLARKSFCSLIDESDSRTIEEAIQTNLVSGWSAAIKEDIQQRCAHLAVFLTQAITQALPQASSLTIASVRAFQSNTQNELIRLWNEISDKFVASPPTIQYLGRGSQALYGFVRSELKVPFHRGFVEHPTVKSNELGGREKLTVGGWLSIINEALIDGRADAVIMHLLNDNSTVKANGLNGRWEIACTKLE